MGGGILGEARVAGHQHGGVHGVVGGVDGEGEVDDAVEAEVDAGQGVAGGVEDLVHALHTHVVETARAGEAVSAVVVSLADLVGLVGRDERGVVHALVDHHAGSDGGHGEYLSDGARRAVGRILNVSRYNKSILFHPTLCLAKCNGNQEND